MHEAVTLTARLLTTALLLMATASAVSAADEANYPSRQIRVVVGFAAGGAPDSLGRAKGANLTYATPGAGSIAHLAAELLARSAGFTMTHVTYRGVTPALTDVLRGEVTMMFSQLSTAKPLIGSGELRALGVASKVRSAALPDVPTIAEAADMPGFEAVSWYALMAPAGTPQAIVAKLHDAAVEAINAPEAKAALEAQGAKPVGNTPAELSAVIAADTARWAKVIRDANIKVAP